MPQPLCTPGLPRIPTGNSSFPEPLPWHTLHDGGQTYQVGGHIGRCAWKGKRQMQTPAQEKTERLSVHPSDSRRRESCEKCRCKRPVLGPEQGSAGVVQYWPHRLIDELLLQLPGRLLLPSELWLIRFWFFLSSDSSTQEGIWKPAAANDRWHSRTAWKHGTGLSAKPATMNSATCGNRPNWTNVRQPGHGQHWQDPDPLLRARGWRTRGRVEELFASRGSGAIVAGSKLLRLFWSH